MGTQGKFGDLGTPRALGYLGTWRALEGDLGTQELKALRQSSTQGIQVLGNFGHFGHSGIWALTALRHLWHSSTQAIWTLKHLSRRGTLFSRLSCCFPIKLEDSLTTDVSRSDWWVVLILDMQFEIEKRQKLGLGVIKQAPNRTKHFKFCIK